MNHRKFIAFLLAGILVCLAIDALGDISDSIQLVGNFRGITCYPDDPENDMIPLGNREWIKLKYIDEPGPPPDTISFKFTENHDYYPEHWGWSFVHGWGIAELGYSPPSIVAVLPDSGYYYFHFNDSSYSYWLDRPQGKICGELTCDTFGDVPEGAKVTLLSAELEEICSCTEFCDNSFCFSHLPPETYALFATAPAYNDTTVSGIILSEGDSVGFDIELHRNTAVAISSVTCERSGNEIILTWTTGSDCEGAGFDVYRGETPRLFDMIRRNTDPVYYRTGYSFVDSGIDEYTDYYYYIIEANDSNGSRYGPIESRGLKPLKTGSLGQNYPNPFNPSTTIPYTVGENGSGVPVTISFFDASGRMVESYKLGNKPSGEYAFEWNPSASGEGTIPSGVYYCRLAIGKETYTRKMILLR